eukprot:CAMPEP_0185856902 /NCGR_PEP_ID=MMETSP1354-20130828/29227_1 /TAXON_ID=708628 /ORGANISM="Erythrolobus madagascarensis, Strain CCMP3276" /LENGTH=193 /DNA_ID=CAMNT_0028559163 /DNA_START=26 /DNA_END=607 /DNA_ORIENTATION=-
MQVAASIGAHGGFGGEALASAAAGEAGEVPAVSSAGVGTGGSSGGGKHEGGLSAQEERILRLQRQAREYEEVERQRHERRLQKQEAKRNAALQKEENYKLELKKTAKRMFWIGCALLPLMWGVMILYFWKEFRNKEGDADEDIRKYCKWALIGFVLFNIVWIAWYAVFVVYSDTKLASMNLVLHQTSFAPVKI